MTTCPFDAGVGSASMALLVNLVRDGTVYVPNPALRARHVSAQDSKSRGRTQGCSFEWTRPVVAQHTKARPTTGFTDEHWLCVAMIVVAFGLR
jgi:hypothetical protein